VRGNDIVDKKTGVLHSPIYNVVHRPPDVPVISKDLDRPATVVVERIFATSS
jgi:hypothetical protein